MLKTNAVLVQLDLQGNEIDEEGARMISEGLKQNTTLQTLILDGGIWETRAFGFDSFHVIGNRQCSRTERNKNVGQSIILKYNFEDIVSEW